MTLYHVIEDATVILSNGNADEGHCYCGRFVTRKVVGFGPSARIITVDKDGGQECDE